MNTDYVIIEGEIFYWPKCSVADCNNRCFLAGGDPYCYPHTKCECGAEKVLGTHSNWCKKYLDYTEDEEEK